MHLDRPRQRIEQQVRDVAIGGLGGFRDELPRRVLGPTRPHARGLRSLPWEREGDHAGADARLAAALAEVETRQSPVLCGSIAEARARVALLAGDMAKFEVHRAEVDRWFRPTRNPTLIARADRLDDLRVPPGNRLESLKGDRAGQHSIRVNDQYRVCFRWTTGGAEDVEIVDYH